MKTLAQELEEEQRRLSRRFIHATRPKRPLSLCEAIELSEKMQSEADYDQIHWQRAGT
jgi:hypothetical protein